MTGYKTGKEDNEKYRVQTTLPLTVYLAVLAAARKYESSVAQWIRTAIIEKLRGKDLD